MKKFTSILFMAVLSFSLTACGSGQKSNSDTAESDNVASEQNQSEQSQSEQSQSEQSQSEQSQSEQNQSETIETAAEGVTEENNTLVVYFSNTGNTRAIAESIANGLSADIYEIIAEVPYTDADLDYGDDNSRSTQEMNDPSARPVISGSVENMEQYDTVYIGYPIWWGEAPRILDTFVESYDFTNKTVIPFCTSSSSGMGSSASILEELAGSGNWLEGQRFSGSESAESVMEWVNGL